MENLQKAGKILKPHGLKGHVGFMILSEYQVDKKDLQVIYIHLSNGPVPFFLTEIRQMGNKWVAKPEGMHKEEDLKLILGKDFLLPAAVLTFSDEGEYQQLIGFTLQDAQLGNIGVVEDVQVFPQHPVIKITYKEKEILLPLSEPFVKEIDEKNRIIMYEAPDGLIDIYLGNA